MFASLHEMIILDTCFFGCSLKKCTFVYLIAYLIVSTYRFAKGLLRLSEFPAWISFTLQSRHVIWSSFLFSAIHEIYTTDKVSYLAPCLWCQAIDLAETIIDYFGFIFTKRVIIPSFGNSNRTFDHNYLQLVIVFPFLVAPFVYLWIVVYSCYHKGFLPEETPFSEDLKPAITTTSNYNMKSHYHVPYSLAY
ncbi:uncharacterized protein LOC135834691 isoform X1 [Planococcus citri]|uniref:uncharacterized protein LOC135834691 isoform X1 n=1 Tax=Planococcus citri TaxID=170843 RepID=UPI0031F9D487